MSQTNSVNSTIRDREVIIRNQSATTTTSISYSQTSDNYQELLLTRNLEHNQPAQRGRQFTSSRSGCFSGKVSIGCTSIIRFTVSIIPGSVSIIQRAASALAMYFRASSSSILARLVCCAAWSKQASSIFCSTSRGFLLSSRNSKEGSTGTSFTLGPCLQSFAGNEIVPRGLRVSSHTFVTLSGGLR